MKNISLFTNGLYVSLSGRCDLDTVLDIKKQFYGSSKYESILYQIWDLTQVQHFDFNENDMKILGALDRSSSRWNNRIKIFVLVKDENFVKLFEVYFCMLKETNWEIKVFPGLKEACLSLEGTNILHNNYLKAS